MVAGKTQTEQKNRPSEKTTSRKRRIGHQFYALCYIIGARTLHVLHKSCVLLSEILLFLWRKLLVGPATAAYDWIRYQVKEAPKERRRENQAWLDSKNASANALLEEVSRLSKEKKDENQLVASRQIDSKLYQYRLLRREIASRKRRMALMTVLPMVSVAVCVTVFAVFSSLEVALKVTYAGKELGYITDEQVYDTAVSDIADRVVGVDSRYNFAATPLYTMSYTTKSNVLDKAEFSDVLLKAVMGDEVNEASGIYINDEFVIAVDDGEKIETFLQSLLEPYREEDPEADVSFLDTVEIRSGMYPVSRIKSYDEAAALLSQVSLHTVRYTCDKNDTVKKIASKNNLSQAVLLQYNTAIEDQISSGKTLEIVVPTPFLRIKTTVREVYKESIPYETVTKNNSNQYEGWSKITKEGKDGVREIVADVFYVDGVEVGREIISSEVVKNPVNAIKQVGTRTAPKSAPATSFEGVTVTGHFLWPVDGGKISCGWYGYAGHQGVDIAAAKGTSIYAADGGVVIAVNKWNYSYGYHVVIDHGNGYKTRYAHMSKIAASVGDKVEKGDVIGYVGNTGNSFGNHCHFEIMINGQRVDPTPYITSK